MLNLVLSGGPSGGKTTSISKIESELTEKLGMKVLIVPETATELIANGISPGENISLEDFQELVLRKQLAKEEMYLEVANKFFDPNKVVIIYDRGILDQLAYIEKNKFDKLISKYDLTMADIVNRYDAIIHLTTAAKGTNCYTTANNVARRETAEEAIIADEKTLAGNMNHPCIKVVDNSTNFEQKIQRVLSIIFDMLNAPLTPSEIERKFLIEYPSKEILDNLDYSSKTDIIQTYLKSNDPNVEKRVRQRGTKESGYSFYYTEKMPISNIERVEKEKKISMRQYVSYLVDADTTLHQIYKTRYCFLYENQYFEMDLYPFSDKYAIIEIELQNKDDEIKLPNFLKVIKEVTNDNDFKNHSLAKTMCFKEIKKYDETDWLYETGRDEPEILGSGSTYYGVFQTRDEKLAFEKAFDGYRNYLIRCKKENGKEIRQWYDGPTRKWIDD